jgi:hypothetical protein
MFVSNKTCNGCLEQRTPNFIVSSLHKGHRVNAYRLLHNNVDYNIKVIVLSEAFYGCDTWSLTLREEQSLRM